MAQKWSDLEIIQKKPLNRHCVRWLVKGIPPDSFQGPCRYSGFEETDETFIHISKMGTRKPVGTKQTWYVEPPKRTCKLSKWGEQELNPENKEKETKEPVGTQLDSETEDVTAGDKRERSPRRSAQGQAGFFTGANTQIPPKTIKDDIINEFISRGHGGAREIVVGAA